MVFQVFLFLDVLDGCDFLHHKQDTFNVIDMKYMMDKRDMIGMILVLTHFVNL